MNLLEEIKEAQRLQGPYCCWVRENGKLRPAFSIAHERGLKTEDIIYHRDYLPGGIAEGSSAGLPQ